MIRFPAAEMRRLTAACEAAYPQEACGLIVGRAEAGRFQVSRLEPSSNLAATPAHAFEIDPRLRLMLQRSLRGTTEAVIGLYHSHPDGRAGPSATDLENAWEPELVWVIAAVHRGRLAEVRAHLLDQSARQFHEIALESA